VTGTDAPDPSIEALCRHLGKARFFRFIATLPSGPGPLLFWQSRELDLLEQREGIVFPREPNELLVQLRPFLPPYPSLAPELLPGWIVFDEFGGSVPVQATGRTVAPQARFYFRSRHDGWSISVSADPKVDPVDVGGTEGAFFYHEEDFGYVRDEASYIPLDVARFFIVRELTRWRTSGSSGAG
jgi:hypothetical protein